MASQYLTDDFVRALTPPAKGNKIYWDADAPGTPFSGVTGFGVRITAASCRAFVLHYRLRDGSGQCRTFTIGKYPYLNVERARLLARKLREDIEIGADPQATKNAKRMVAKSHHLDVALTLHDRVAAKFASFLKDGIEPGGYLYRHYDPHGDLLYVGVTQSISERTKSHLSKATWRDLICMIIVEPFETREEVLEAERDAILNEFPKYNRVLNKHRHPIQEVKKRYVSRKSARRQANDQRYRNVIAHRAATADQPMPSSIDIRLDLLRQAVIAEKATEKAAAEKMAEKAAAEKAATAVEVNTDAANTLVPRAEAAWELGISEQTLRKMRPPTTLVKCRAYVDMGQLRQMIADSISRPTATPADTTEPLTKVPEMST